MMSWTVLCLLILLIIVSYLILRKFYMEHKIKSGRQNLAGKVVKCIYLFLSLQKKKTNTRQIPLNFAHISIRLKIVQLH